jgi:GNAT superfamily N-acetyltransferase
LAPSDAVGELIRLREEFLQLVIPQLPPRTATEQWLQRQIDSKKLYILKEGQKIVSIASSDRESPDYESISMVRIRTICLCFTSFLSSCMQLYTPDEFRGHGYATQLIWTLTKELLGKKKAVLLGIDSRNAISYAGSTNFAFLISMFESLTHSCGGNRSHLYRKIGYRVIFEQGHYCIPSLLKSLEGN